MKHLCCILNVSEVYFYNRVSKGALYEKERIVEEGAGAPQARGIEASRIELTYYNT
jgi:hypothetical protein